MQFLVRCDTAKSQTIHVYLFRLRRKKGGRGRGCKTVNHAGKFFAPHFSLTFRRTEPACRWRAKEAKVANANRWLALEAACRGKDSVIIRCRLEKLLPNPGIDSPTVARESVRNSRTLLHDVPFFSTTSKGGRWKKTSAILSYPV